MSEKVIIALIVMIGLNICVANLKTSEFKYQIITSNGATLLLDKEKGYVWNNIIIDNKIRMPNWEYMNYSGAVVPDGEQEIRNERFKRIQKESGVKL
jgi:hypothetical protein